jgi:hypothetical protein
LSLHQYLLLHCCHKTLIMPSIIQLSNLPSLKFKHIPEQVPLAQNHFLITNYSIIPDIFCKLFLQS